MGFIGWGLQAQIKYTVANRTLSNNNYIFMYLSIVIFTGWQIDALKHTTKFHPIKYKMRTTDDWLFFSCVWSYLDPACIKLYHYYGNLGVPFVKEQKMEHAEDDNSAPRFIRLIFEHDALVRYD